MREWIKDNLTMSDVVILSVVALGIIGVIAGVKELATAALGAASTYVVKDKSRKTQEMEKEIVKERAVHDDKIKATVEEVVRKHCDADIDELVDLANERLRRGDGKR